MSEGGRLVAVVGPSGVGKDTLIDALAEARPGLLRVRRTITRPPGPGERFDSVTDAEFDRLAAAGAFCLTWAAHGLRYGLPAGVAAHVAGGGEAVANLSRRALGEAARLFPRLLVLHLTARPETLADRLGARGREDGDAIRARLLREEPLPVGLPAARLSTDAPVGAVLAQALAALYAEAAP